MFLINRQRKRRGQGGILADVFILPTEWSRVRFPSVPSQTRPFIKFIIHWELLWIHVNPNLFNIETNTNILLDNLRVNKYKETQKDFICSRKERHADESHEG